MFFHLSLQLMSRQLTACNKHTVKLCDPVMCLCVSQEMGRAALLCLVEKEDDFIRKTH